MDGKSSDIDDGGAQPAELKKAEDTDALKRRQDDKEDDAGRKERRYTTKQPRTAHKKSQRQQTQVECLP